MPSPLPPRLKFAPNAEPRDRAKTTDYRSSLPVGGIARHPARQLGWFSGADDREQDLTLLSGAFTERIIT